MKCVQASGSEAVCEFGCHSNVVERSGRSTHRAPVWKPYIDPETSRGVTFLRGQLFGRGTAFLPGTILRIRRTLDLGESSHVLFTLALLLFPLFNLPAPAQEKPATPPPELAPLIEQLGDTDFQVREAASTQLLSMASNHLKSVTRRLLKTCHDRSFDPETRGRAEDILKHIVKQHIYHRPRGLLGISMRRVNNLQDPTGEVIPAIVVSSLLADSQAAKAGVQMGDYILAVDGKRIGPKTANTHFIRYIQSHRPGDKVTLKIFRDPEIMEIEITLGISPPHISAPFRSPLPFEKFFAEWLEKRKPVAASAPAPSESE